MTILAPAVRWFEKAHWLIAASIVRIAFGSIVLALYALHLSDREFLFGPNGLLPYDELLRLDNQSHIFSIYGLNGSEIYFNALYAGGLIVAALFVLGYRTRVIGPVFAVVAWSHLHRMPYMMDGGYRLMTILLIFLAFADLSRHFSLDAVRRERSGRPERDNFSSNMIHNAAILTCIMQVCVVYMFSTFSKIAGATWQDGSAVYYALGLTQFNSGPISDTLRSNPFLINLLTYGTLLYQSSFPWLVWHPRAKYVVLAIAVLFHGSIGIAMGLFWFSAVMISCEAIFVSDEAYVKFFALIKSLRTRYLARPHESSKGLAAPQS